MRANWPPPEMDYEFIAVDFDGTLFENAFPNIGEPKRHVIEWCKSQQQKGAKVILHTCREAQRLEEALKACAACGLHPDAINENPFTEWTLTEQSKKPFADIYLDDRAWRVT
jgi:hypothetical protein